MTYALYSVTQFIHSKTIYSVPNRNMKITSQILSKSLSFMAKLIITQMCEWEDQNEIKNRHSKT